MKIKFMQLFLLYTVLALFNFTLQFHINAAEELVIIGKGSAGCSAAIFAGQVQLSPLVVEGQECDGQLMNVHRIENYPGFPEGINGEELVERMRLQAENFGARFKNNYINHANFRIHPFELTLDT